MLVIGPPAADAQVMTEDAIWTICCATSLQRDSVKDAVAHAVELSGRPRREIYARALELAKETKQAADATMAKTDGAAPPDKPAKIAAPERVAAFRTGLSAEARAAAYLMAKGYRILAQALSHAPWRDRHRGAQAQPGRLCRGQGARQPG